ncbi:hypothetical protein COOONC_06877 [Cooperia oncophora]
MTTQGQIYTDWVNRYLSKAPNYKPIDDISNELRDYRLVAKLIQVVVLDRVESMRACACTEEIVRLSTDDDGYICLFPTVGPTKSLKRDYQDQLSLWKH